MTLALPGFATRTPARWDATKESYAAWLESELVAIGEPVDLVGHDWGAILVQRVASIRPDLVRTVACGSGPLDDAYEWHAMAQLWQTPTVGEEIIAGMLTLPIDELVAGLEAGGAPPALAALQAGALDETMASCILALYRSAVTVGAEWQPAVAAMTQRPAIVFHGADDPYVALDVADRIAARLAAEYVVFASCQHWWPWERAAETAAALTRFWSR
jgi:pimeloyl-ACP methyl ester carboxylesterase